LDAGTILSSDDQYIFTDFVIRLDGISYGNWSKYLYDDNDYEEEHVTTWEYFHNMIESEAGKKRNMKWCSKVK
jgi:hypothetical protein